MGAMLLYTLGVKEDGIVSKLKMSEILKKMQENETLKNAAGFIETMKAVKNLILMIDGLTCQIDGLAVALSSAKIKMECGFKLDLSIVWMDLQSIYDALEIIETKDFTRDGLSAAERVKALNRTAAKLDEVSLKIERIVEVINEQNVVYLNREASKLSIDNSKGLTYNRYR
jgi:VP2 protein